MRSRPPDSESSDADASALAEELRIVFGALIRRLREQADVGDLTFAQKSVLLRLERDGPATGSALRSSDRRDGIGRRGPKCGGYRTQAT